MCWRSSADYGRHLAPAAMTNVARIVSEYIAGFQPSRLFLSPFIVLPSLRPGAASSLIGRRRPTEQGAKVGFDRCSGVRSNVGVPQIPRLERTNDRRVSVSLRFFGDRP